MEIYIEKFIPGREEGITSLHELGEGESFGEYSFFTGYNYLKLKV